MVKNNLFSPTIFKQTFRANSKLWLIFTLILCVLGTVIISVFDQKTITSMMALIEDTPMANMIKMTSLLGMLAQTYYALHIIILTLIYIIITANSLIASQVDRGSMAYILSTPIKRSVVVRTQAVYLIGSLFLMFLTITLTGLLSVQIFHGGIIGEQYTEDVKAASDVLNLSEKEVAGDLNLILSNPDAISAGADARGLEIDIYKTYLELKMMDPVQLESMKNAPQVVEMQEKISKGIAAAATVLNLEVSELASDMGLIQSNPSAMEAAVSASGIPEEGFIQIINRQLASDELVKDDGIDFVTLDYVMMNLGVFLLMFAISSISFLFSCLFNLSKNSLALGAGIPIAFYIFKLMGDVDGSLEFFKYLSLNTLFDTDAIINGGDYSLQFVVLGVVGIVLYALSVRIFVEKDLPL